MRWIEAFSRTGTRKRVLESLLEAQEGPDGRLEHGFDPSKEHEST